VGIVARHVWRFVRDFLNLHFEGEAWIALDETSQSDAATNCSKTLQGLWLKHVKDLRKNLNVFEID